MRLTIFGKTFSVGESTNKPERKEPSIKSSNEFGINLLNSNYAGQTVNLKTASELDTVYACIRDKAESCGQLPVLLTDNEGKRLKSGRMHKIFTMRPNDFQTMGEFTETAIACMESFGHFRAYVLRNKYGNISQIIPFRNQLNVTVNMDSAGRIYYTYSTNDGKPGMAFSDGEIMDIKLFTTDGFHSLSPISYNARLIGIGIAQEEHVSTFMSNQARPSGVLETDLTFQDENKAQQLVKEWSKNYAGGGSGKTALLENGVKYKPITLSPADIELVKQRTFTRLQLCAIFRVPPHRVGIVESKAYDRLEDNNRAYMRDSLVPLLKKIEDWFNWQLRDSRLTFKYDENGFTRGDRLSQVEAIGKEVSMGLAEINEARIDLGRPAKEGGDVFAIDTNNLTFGRLTDIPNLQAEARASQQTAQAEPVEDNENA